MSLGTLLQKVGTWIGNIFKKGADELENVILPATIAITNALKNVLETDTADILGSIAGAAGKEIEDKVRSILETVVPKLQLAQAFKGQDPNTILANVLKLISPSEEVTKTAFWIEWSGLVAQAFANDGKIDSGEMNAILKYFYDHQADIQAANTSANEPNA